MLKFTEKLKLENNNAVVLITGLRQQGKEVLAELEMTKEQIQQLEIDSKMGKQIILTKYGKVIDCSWA